MGKLRTAALISVALGVFAASNTHHGAEALGNVESNPPLQAWYFQMPLDQSMNEQVLFYTAQGLLNRFESRMWLIEPVFWTYNLSTIWFIDNYLVPQKGFTFTQINGTFCDLAAATQLFSPAGPVAGLALYNDSALDSSRWLAATQSGLDGLLPVTRELLSNVSYSCLDNLPIKADYSNPTAYNWTTNLDAYAWAATNLLPLCNGSSIYSAGYSYADSTGSVYIGDDPAIDIGIDGAIALKMMIFNLSPDTDKYPQQAAMFTSLVGALRHGNVSNIPTLYGWAEPEPAMTLSTSKGGGSVQCDAAPNLSFWLHVASSPPRFPYNVNANLTLQPEHIYITWQSNEGDTPKEAAALQAGAWLDPQRGTIPIAWGLDPLLLELAPGLLEFYANTATANDTWFSATAGAGYAYPWVFPEESFVAYVNRAAGLINRLTPGWPAYSWEVDVWDNNWPSNVTAYATVAGTALGAMSMQPEEMPGTNTWLLNSTFPLIIANHSMWYPLQWKCVDDPDQFYVSTIADTYASIKSSGHQGPVFMLVYGIAPADACGNTMYHYAHMVQDRMGGGGAFPGTNGTIYQLPALSVVGMQDLVRLAREAGKAFHQ